MVLPVSGFLPVPLPMMIPFMGAQSLVIGKMFGEGFQYGKRKISAMPNEEFNKLTFEAMMSNARDEMQASIPTMIQAMQDMKPMVNAVIHEFTNYLSLVIQAAPDVAGGVVSDVAHAVAPHAEAQIPSGHTEEMNIFETIAEQFPHVHEAGAVDMPQKVSFPLAQPVSSGSLERERLRRIAEIERLALLKQSQIKKGQAGLKISQKVQRIPLTYSQTKLFLEYKRVLEKNNRYKQTLKKQGLSSNSRKALRVAIPINDKILATYREQINRAKSVNLKGFELYFKWLMQQ